MKNDGKYLEKAVEDYLKTIKISNFHWRRLPDARAARGSIPAQPSDFFVSIWDGRKAIPFHLECKSSNSRTRRIQKPSQYAQMIRWDKAGIEGIILVHFWELDKFALVNVADFDPDKPSIVVNACFDSVIEALGELKEIT